SGCPAPATPPSLCGARFQRAYFLLVKAWPLHEEEDGTLETCPTTPQRFAGSRHNAGVPFASCKTTCPSEQGNVGTNAPYVVRSSSRPVAVSEMRSVRSTALAVTRRVPSGVRLIVATAPPCAKRRIGAPSGNCHRWTTKSAPRTYADPPSGAKVTPLNWA